MALLPKAYAFLRQKTREKAPLRDAV